VRSLVSLNSKFDKYMRRETEQYSAAERNGFNLFMGKAKCGTCHFAPLFGGLLPPLYEEMETEILGVPKVDSTGALPDDDPGKSGFTRVPSHRYAFKTSTVRNAALTAPYMHNGVFRTLEDVVRFYNDGGGAGRGIDVPTQTLPADKLGLTKKEMKDIVAFVNSLTDTSGTSFGKALGR
jgi:cytochrome c peroxidase